MRGCLFNKTPPREIRQVFFHCNKMMNNSGLNLYLSKDVLLSMYLNL